MVRTFSWKHLWRLALSVVVVLLTSAYGCEATPGTIELRNESTDHLVWVSTSPDLLADAIEGRRQMQTIRPGGTSSAQMTGAFEPDWCEASRVVGYLLRPLDGRAIDSDRWPIRASLDDFEIVAEQGPGFCWGEKHATWTFDG